MSPPYSSVCGWGIEVDFGSCQCGISRSATLSVAYLMALAATGIMPEYLGHLTGMQDTYAFVKAKSACIGPNIS